MYRTTVYKALISCPSDIDENTKNVIYQEFDEYNRNLSETTGVALLANYWSKDSYPASGQKAQTELNIQLVDKCDLVLAIFWHRAGTPTENEISGTVEEIELAKKQNKPVMIYFCTNSAPDNHDTNQKRILDEKIKPRYLNSGLICEYEDIDEFRQFLKNHLQKITTTNPYFMTAKNQNELEITEDIFSILETCDKNSGDILFIRMMSESCYNGLYSGDDTRKLAKIKSAMDKLINVGAIDESTTSKGTPRFSITDIGYQLLDKIKASQSL